MTWHADEALPWWILAAAALSGALSVVVALLVRVARSVRADASSG